MSSKQAGTGGRPSVRETVDEALRDSAELWRDVAESALDPPGCEATAAVLEDLRAALAEWHGAWLHVTGGGEAYGVGADGRLARLLAPREGRTEGEDT